MHVVFKKPVCQVYTLYAIDCMCPPKVHMLKPNFQWEVIMSWIWSPLEWD